MKHRATVSATDLRVRLGEMLRRLEDEDLVIEKGGIPVAVLSRYEPSNGGPQAGDRPTTLHADREEEVNAADILARIDEIRARGAARRRSDSVASPADDAVWDAISRDFRNAPPSEMDADALIADVYRARQAGSRLNRYYILTEDGLITEVGDERTYEAADRQRHMHRRDFEPRSVADRGDEEYEA